ncbi:hypothetical protein AU198_25530 [Mycobacterium sp. GA-1199]|nr:hypothetical protein AU198_25530 [Mycobacterium sp. GA-1199]
MVSAHNGLDEDDFLARFAYLVTESRPEGPDRDLASALFSALSITPRKNAGPLQRWCPRRNLPGSSYVCQWIDDFREGRARGRSREEPKVSTDGTEVAIPP